MIRLGIAANWRQFSLLVAVNAFVGAMVGLERTILPLLAEDDFGVATASAALSFIVAFGVVKAGANLFAGVFSDRLGRKRLLVAGWLAALPVAPMIIWAPTWGWVVAANVLLGVNQGFAWSATVIMKIDLAGPRRRGTAMALNEVAGYGAVAVVAWATGALAAVHGPRPAPYLLGIGISIVGLAVSVAFVRETSGHVAEEARQHLAGADAGGRFREVFMRTSFRDRSLSSVCLGGLANNLNDGMAWGLLPIYLASRGLGFGRIGVVAAVYPGVWTLAQLATGAWSDRAGRKGLIVSGLLVQAAGIFWFVAADGYGGWLGAAAVMGLGTAMVYPTLLAAVGDVAHPGWRASAVGVYRLWRDSGYAVGALLSGLVADLFGTGTAIAVVGVVTAAAGLAVWMRMEETLDRRASGAREEGDMRAIDCPCGHTLQGADDEELFRVAKEHMAADHPDMQRTDDQIRQRVAADARDV